MADEIDPAIINCYHAHIYYDDASRDTAAHLRETIERIFKVEMGRWREEPVGPHPQAMYQVKFDPDEFARDSSVADAESRRPQHPGASRDRPTPTSTTPSTRYGSVRN